MNSFQIKIHNSQFIIASRSQLHRKIRSFRTLLQSLSFGLVGFPKSTRFMKTLLIAQTLTNRLQFIVSEFQSCDSFILERLEYKTQKTDKYQVINLNDQIY